MSPGPVARRNDSAASSPRRTKTVQIDNGGIARAHWTEPIRADGSRARDACAAVCSPARLRANGAVEAMQATAAVETQLEAELLRNGGVIPTILKKAIEEEIS